MPTTTDLVSPNAIIPAMKVNGKKQALQEIAAKAASLTGQNEKAILEILLQREKLGSTGVGNGVAIPHGKLPGLPGLLAAFGRKRAGVDFAAIDGKPTFLLFLLFAPDNSAGLHLKALARISRLFKQPQFRQSIMNAEDAAAIFRLIAEEDAKY